MGSAVTCADNFDSVFTPCAKLNVFSLSMKYKLNMLGIKEL